MMITIVAGARPNFMKIAPIIRSIQMACKKGVDIGYRLVHTGQHYDQVMSQAFFEELNIPEPDVNLGAGSGTQAEQTAAIMVAFERDLIRHPSDLVMVVGDVTSTLACSIVAKKLNTKVAHVEAGIRSGDLKMPEEINRMVTDSISDYFFTTSLWAGDNLRRNGVTDDRIFFVGNVMIDTLHANRARFQKPLIWDEARLKEKHYLVMTLHRPSNVDREEKFRSFLEAIMDASRDLPVIFPVHPRTRKIINHLNNGSRFGNHQLKLIDPLGYLQFNYLVERAKAVITDSGGITEETTVMGVPCITLRDSTERPETVEVGTNELIGTRPGDIKPAMEKLFAGQWKAGSVPELWDGKTAERIVKHVMNLYGS